MDRINEICEDLSVQILKWRVRNHESRAFFPNGAARDVLRMNEEVLHELFRTLLSHDPVDIEIVSDIVRRVVRNLSTTLAVVLQIRTPGNVDILRRFVDLTIHKNTLRESPILTDDDLPISLDKARLVFSTMGNEFFDAQFQFCAITLRREGDVDYQEYRSQCPLPYKRQEKIGGGAYGEVYKVKIERRHLRSTGDRTGNIEPEWLARKDFKRQQSFTVELDVLRAIMKQPQKHDHLVMVLAILQYGDTNSLFFPLADCDLHQYLNGKYHGDKPAPSTLEGKSAIFNRGVALAGALAFLHGGFGGAVCLHLDLKPSNVLVYDAYGADKEIWKITDFGLTRVRNREYSSVGPGIEGIYLPPECATPGDKVDTRSDVWSFGCIFSLVITYMIYGTSGVKDFTEKRGERPEGDYFYITSKKSTPRVSPAVASWFDRLRRSAPSNETESRVIRESLDYLQRKVLHPIRQERAAAKDVESALKKIQEIFTEQAPPLSPLPSQDQARRNPFLERLLVRLQHRTSESPVSRLQSFGYDLGTNGFGFRFSPPNGDYLAFFSSQRTLLWTVSESLRIADGVIKSFSVSSNSICVCLDGDSFDCHIYTVDGPSSSVRVDDGTKVSYEHMGYIKRVTMSSDGALAAFIISDRPRGSESDCRIYLAYTQSLIDTADEGSSYYFPRSSRSNSVSESSLMSVTTAANLIVEKVSVGPASHIRFLDFTPDGKFLVILIQDGSRGFAIRAWETYSGRCYRDFSVAIQSSQTFRSLFTTCCLFVTKAAEPCVVVVADHRRILHVNLTKRTHSDRGLDSEVHSMFVCNDGQTLVLIGKKNGLRAYLLPLTALDRSKFIGAARINRLSYVPALDDAAVTRDVDGQLKLLIASSSGQFLDMGIDN
ncbi:kinase-like domain-containing protein [Aspergillus undulatus]|uniref:kinase-like domain-containing protein n=1 Tax=Aspergillus undulatus TaxID=1810928 RepID=UPI003CCE1A59